MNKVYAVMEEAYNGERDVTEVYALYANKNDAEEFVASVMSGRRSAYSPTYWIDDMEVIG